MLASINPLGERARGTRWGRTASWYVAGSVAGGASVSVAAAALGVVVFGGDGPGSTFRAVIVAVAAAIGLAFDTGLGGLRLPTVHRQVDEDWLARYRGWLYGVGFGFQLGLGVVTIVTTATVYVMLVLAALTADLAAGLVIGVTFGLGRAMPLLGMRSATDPARVRSRLRVIATRAPSAELVARGCLGSIVVAGIVAAAV